MQAPSSQLTPSFADHSDAAYFGEQPPGVWTAFKRHKLLGISLALGILGLTAAVILFYPRTYHSTAKLLLKIGKESTALDPTATTAGEILSVHRTRESEVLTVLEVMTSREILDGVAERIGEEAIARGSLPGEAKPRPPGVFSFASSPLKNAIKSIDPIGSHEQAIVELESNLRIDAPDEAGVVTVEYLADTPMLAQRVVQEWVALFQDHYIASTRTRGAFEFFQQQDALLTSKLEDIRQRLMEAKNQFGLITIDGQQQLLEEQLQSVQLTSLSVEANLTETASRIESLEEVASTIQLTSVTEEVTGKPNQAFDRMRAQLYELEIEEKRLAAFMAKSHPTLKAVRDQLNKASKVLANEVLAKEEPQNRRSEVTEGINPTRQAIDEKLALQRAEEQALRTKSRTLIEQRKSLRLDLEELNRNEQVVRDLNRRLEVLEERYREHSKRFEQARLDQALERGRISSVNIVQSPTLERRPVTPRKKLCAALGLFAAFAAALGAPMWIESGRSLNMQRSTLIALTRQKDEQDGSNDHTELQATLGSPTLPR